MERFVFLSVLFFCLIIFATHTYKEAGQELNKVRGHRPASGGRSLREGASQHGLGAEDTSKTGGSKRPAPAKPADTLHSLVEVRLLGSIPDPELVLLLPEQAWWKSQVTQDMTDPHVHLNKAVSSTRETHADGLRVWGRLGEWGNVNHHYMPGHLESVAPRER